MTLNKESYSGSRILESFGGLLGLPVDQVNVLTANIISLLCALIFRSHFHYSKVPTQNRHIFSLVIGVILCLFCIGHEVLYLAIQATVAYILMYVVPPHYMHISVLAWSFGFLSIKHFHRMTYNYGSYILDATGPLMILTQKLTSLAFSYHDGKFKDESELSSDQRNHCIRELPSILEFFSYVFSFPCVLVGPLVFYNDYDRYITGDNFKTVLNRGITSHLDEPSPMPIFYKKLCYCLLAGSVVFFLLPRFPPELIYDTVHISKTGILRRSMYVYISLLCQRYKYYFIWLLAELACHLSGLGFSGLDEHGNSQWEIIDNVDVLAIETSTSIKSIVEKWNKHTIIWLRRICYNRITFQRVLVTNMLSAAWHGFYPGYYLTFVSIAISVLAARRLRRMFRHHFLSPDHLKVAYDIFTWFASHVIVTYLMVPFVLLQFSTSISYYSSVYFIVHLFLIGVLFIPSSMLPHRGVHSSSNLIHNHAS